MWSGCALERWGTTRYRAELAALVADDRLRGTAFCRAYTTIADRWFTELFDRATAGAGTDGLAVVAIGGYGRGDLCPASDLDVILLHRGRRERRDLKAIAEGIWYPLWDSGVKLGHGVRSVKEALALAGQDLDTATAVLDTRVVAGDAALAEDLAVRAAAQWRARSGRWLGRLAAAVASRHARAGEVAFRLEPDLKEGRGGLRDVHSLRWAEAARRILIEGDDRALAGAHDTILAVRVELHRRTGKPGDRLLLQEQDAVAQALGERDADSLMARVAAAARAIAWTSDEAWDRITSSLQGPSGRVAAVDHALGPGLVRRERLVEIAPGFDVGSDPTLVLRAAAAAAQSGIRLSRAAIDRLAADAPGPGDPWPPQARGALVQLLATGVAAIPIFEALDQKGLLVRILPEWQAVRSRPQRNAYHQFTVDRHLCEAAAGAAELAQGSPAFGRTDLLLVGTWLHDIGKGFTTPEAPDHTQTGIEVVRRIGPRMGFPPADVEVLVALVRHHLLLSEVATRRDLDDPATVARVGEAVGDVETLTLLHALTEADARATGPAAWSPWKGGLVADLVARVERLLRGQDAAAPVFPEPVHLDLVVRARADNRAVIQAAGRAVTIAAPDHPGMFCQMAGTLALHGLDILAARAWSSDDGMALEDFRIEPVFGGEPAWDAISGDLLAALSGQLPLEERLSHKARQYSSMARPTAAAPPRTQVTVDNTASETATVVEVRAPDRMGTLYRITRALADLKIDIRHAKVSSLGHEVVDSFYVVDASGNKVTDSDGMAELQQAVVSQLQRPL